MQILIIEDEITAASRLKKLILECDPDIQVMAVLDSVLDATNFLVDNQPDLIFLDIQLSDGICFEIFEQIELNVPIIFTTAFDEYMQNQVVINC